MASGIGAMQSMVSRLSKKVPKQSKISVVYQKTDGTILWPSEEKINHRGVLILPEPMSEIEWELYCAAEVKD